ncbi:MAG: hypothetical protein ACD_76C00130G0004 [uncultured bacterium]|nr:MAG: hypothetical protein ACD_76C00130G0004 [uncultured bacterium]
MSAYLIIYFFAGVLQDFLFTINIRSVAKHKIFLALTSSFLVTIVNMIVLYNILTQLEADKTIIAIITYALGITAGTYLAMKLKIGLNK